MVSFAVNPSDGNMDEHKIFRVVDSGGIIRFDVSQLDTSTSVVLSCFQCYFTQTDWLSSRYKWDIWSKKHEKWNNDGRKLKYGLKNLFFFCK